MTMRISKEALTALRAKLPRGSVTKIRARLIKKHNPFSQQYIYRCLDPNHKDYNPDIIDEAILFREELGKNKDDQEGRVSNL
jgi:hypothetical protein